MVSGRPRRPALSDLGLRQGIRGGSFGRSDYQIEQVVLAEEGQGAAVELLATFSQVLAADAGRARFRRTGGEHRARQGSTPCRSFSGHSPTRRAACAGDIFGSTSKSPCGSGFRMPRMTAWKYRKASRSPARCHSRPSSTCACVRDRAASPHRHLDSDEVELRPECRIEVGISPSARCTGGTSL